MYLCRYVCQNKIFNIEFLLLLQNPRDNFNKLASSTVPIQNSFKVR